MSCAPSGGAHAKTATRAPKVAQRRAHRAFRIRVAGLDDRHRVDAEFSEVPDPFIDRGQLIRFRPGLGGAAEVALQGGPLRAWPPRSTDDDRHGTGRTRR